MKNIKEENYECAPEAPEATNTRSPRTIEQFARSFRVKMADELQVMAVLPEEIALGTPELLEPPPI